MNRAAIDDLIARFEQGDRRACGQVASAVENDDESAPELLRRLYHRTGRAYRVGITGPPGAGKSTLVEQLAQGYRQAEQKLGIVAVDPTSPFSGGAILGDRVRMSSLFTDPNVFIRSMASRGSLGGLAHRTKEVCDVLDAFGFELILIETIGVGQVELDIAGAADTTVVVLVPESGDSIQALKAGLMEVGNVFAVNKSDREGADRLALAVRTVLDMREWPNGWKPVVIKTVATNGTGVSELIDAVAGHRACLSQNRGLERRRLDAARREIVELVEQRIESDVWADARVQRALDHVLPGVAERRTTPHEAAQEIWQAWQGE